MGMMNKDVAEIIGAEFGRFLDVDAEENGMAAGRYLRVKVRIDIRQVLRRGIVVEIEEEEVERRWCPVEYEFLPEFCYSCGIIGHMDKNCERRGEGGDTKQYGKWLRVTPVKRRFSEEIRSPCPAVGYRPLLTHPSRRSDDWRKDKEVRQQVLAEDTNKKLEGRKEATDREVVVQKKAEALVDANTLMHGIVPPVSGGTNTEAVEIKENNGKMKGTYKRRNVIPRKF